MKRKHVIGMLLFCLLSAAVHATTMAHWKFNDRAAGTTLAAGDRVVDSSGRGNDLYVNTGTTYGFYDYASPLFYDEGALRLAVNNGHLYFQPGHVFGDGGPAAGSDLIGDMASINFTYEVIFRCPYNATSTTVNGLLSKISGGSADPQFWWRIESAGGTKLNFLMRDALRSAGVSYTFPSAPGLYDGQWHHVAVVRDYDYSTLKLYIDYQQVGENTNTGFFEDAAMTVPFAVGSFAAATNRDFVGNIDQVRISHAALTPVQFLPKDTGARPANPVPADKAFDIPVGSVVLSWDTAAMIDPDNVISSQTVTVAADRNMENVITTYNNVTGSSVTLSGVLAARDYYWRVDTVGTDAGVPFSRTGTVWRFQAEEAAGNIAGFWKFDDVVPGTVISEGDMVLDSSGNSRHLYTQYEVMESPLSPNYANPNAAYGSGGSYQAYTDSQLKLLAGYNFGPGKISGGGIYLPSTESLTIETVFRVPAGSTNVSAVLSYLPDHPEETYWFGSNLPQMWLRVQDTGVLRFWMQDNLFVSSWVDSTVAVNDGQWHHIAAVRNKTSNQVQLYVDYVNVTTKADTMTADIVPNGYMVVGGFHGYNSRNLSGSMDFVKVTRAALAPAQFVQAFALPTNPNPVDGATGVPIAYTLSWTPITGATITSQTVKVATDPYMLNVIKTITAGGNSAQVTGLENNMTYYWRVDTVGSDTGGAFSRQSEIWSFSTPACLLTVEMGNLFNEDCIIDLQDFLILASNWLRSEFSE